MLLSSEVNIGRNWIGDGEYGTVPGTMCWASTTTTMTVSSVRRQYCRNSLRPPLRRQHVGFRSVRRQHVGFYKSRENAASFVMFRPGFLVKFLLQETGLMVRGWPFHLNSNSLHFIWFGKTIFISSTAQCSSPSYTINFSSQKLSLQACLHLLFGSRAGEGIRVT